MSEALDYSFLAGVSEDAVPAEAAAPTAAGIPPTGNAKAVAPATATTMKAEDEIAEFLLGDSITESVTDDEPDAEPEAKAPSAKPKPEAAAKPFMPDPRLLYAAGAVNMTPDEAASYPSNDALAAVVRDRQRRMEEAKAFREAEEKAAPKEDELPVPDFKVDDDADPAIKSMAEQMKQFATDLKNRTDAEKKAMRAEVERIQSEQSQDRARETRKREATIAKMFDDQVAAWGDDFKEIIGTPTEAWSKPGTSQHAEVQRLREYAMQRKIGFETLQGREASDEELAGFIAEARYALWPNQAEQGVRKKVSDGLKKQRGGVALRPTKARDIEPVEQGDDAAKAAIADFSNQVGWNPWGPRKKQTA